MNYVVLYIDLEFIVGTVCTDNGNSYLITNGNDDLLWLYFYNDPHSNSISFGKNNRDNANKEVTNYYGKFFNIITDGHTTFKKGEFQKKAIELLQYSDLLKTVKNKYADVTKEKMENIHTLITFSLSISYLAKQKTVEYLKLQGFQIDSYIIPLAELVGYYPYSKKDFLPANGSPILLLAATNHTLYIMKLVFSDNYFMLDGEVKKYEGMGIDPRKRALVGYVINQINISVGALNENEIPAEVEKKEFKADEWLKKIDAKARSDDSPVRISESLSPMPSSMRDVLVKKSDIEEFTNDFVSLLIDYFNAYKKDVKGDIAGIFLLGDCFNNSLVKQCFNNLFKDGDERKKKLFAYANKDIQDILSVYPKYFRSKESLQITLQEQNKEKADKIVIEADKLFAKKFWKDAKSKYEVALKLCPNDKSVQGKIRDCSDKLKAIENLIFDADILIENDKIEQALSKLKEALEMQPDNKDIEEKITKFKKQLKFIHNFGGTSSSNNNTKSTSTKVVPTQKKAAITDSDNFLKKK